MVAFRRLALPVLLLLAGLLAGCGGDGGSDEAAREPTREDLTRTVVRAVSTTRAAGSADVRIRATIGTGGRQVPMRGTGTYDFAADAGRLELDIDAPGLEGPIETIQRGEEYYLRMPALSSRLPGGAEWIAFESRELAGEGAGAGLTGPSFGGSDPTQYLEYLSRSARDVRRLGTAEVAGVPTTRYRATIDLATLARDGDRALKRSVEEVRRQTGLARLPVEVFVDDEGRVRRQTARYPLRAGAGEVAFTVEFPRFGVEVDASPPPAQDVVDFSELLEQSSTSPA